MGKKTKKQSVVTTSEPQPSETERLQDWASKGGGEFKGEKPIELRFPVDMKGLAAVLTQLAYLVVACRTHRALEPTQNEERAIKKLKYHAEFLGSVLQSGNKPPEENMRRTIENAQRLLDGIQVDWDRFFAKADKRIEQHTEEVRKIMPTFLTGENATKIEFLTREFHAAMESPEAKPLDKIKAYKAVMNFLDGLEQRARHIKKLEEREMDRKSERREVGQDILTAIDLL